VFSSPEDLNRDGFRNINFILKKLDDRQSPKKYIYILSVSINYSQSPTVSNDIGCVYILIGPTDFGLTFKQVWQLYAPPTIMLAVAMLMCEVPRTGCAASSDFLPNCINRLVFVTKLQYLYCDVEIKSYILLHEIYTLPAS
jgi:hypothetical protein